MAKIKLELESNAEQGISVVNDLSKSVSNLNEETKDYGKTSQKAFTSVTNEVSDLNTEIKQTTKQTKALEEGAKSVGNAGNRIKELRNEIKTLTAEALAAGEGTKIFAENLKRAGQLKDEIDDINAVLSSVAANAGGKLAKALGTTTEIGAQGFEAVVAAQSLVGVKSEEVEKQLLKLQAVKSIANLAGEFADLKDKITEIKLGLSPVTDALQNQISTVSKGYSSANETLKGFFSNFGPNIANSIKGAGSSITGFFKNFGANAAGLFSSLGTGIKDFAKAGVAGIKSLGAALAANPLGIILVVIGAVIAIFVALKDKIKPVAAVFEFLSGVIDSASEALSSLGEALGLVASQSEKNAKATIADTDKAVEAIEKRYNREIKLAQAAGKETGEIEKEKLKAEFNRVAKSVALLEAKKVAGQKLNEEELKDYEKLNEKLLDLRTDFQAESIKQQVELKKKQDEINKKAAEDAKKAAEERKKRQQDLQTALLDLEKKAEQAQLQTLSGEARLLKQREINNRELEDLRAKLIEKGKLTDKDFKLSIEQEQQLANIKLAIDKEFNDAFLKLQIDRANATAAAQKKEIDSELAFIELKAQLAEKQVSATQAPKDSTKDQEAAFEVEKQIKILEIKRQAAQDSLAIRQKQIDAEANVLIVGLNNELKTLEGKTDEISKARINAINKEIDSIKTSAGISKEIAVAETTETVNSINKELSKLGEGVKPKKIDLKGLLGGDANAIKDAIKLKVGVEVKTEDVEAAKAAIQQMFEAIKSIVNDAFEAANAELDNQLKLSDAAIAKRDENLSKLDEQLATEKALRDQGLANNTKAVEQAIEKEKAARAAELEQRRKIQQEKKKLAKEQLIIDTALGASQLVLAIAQLFGALSSFTIGPVPVGLIIAIAASAAMIGAFVSGKAKAFQALESGGGAGFAKGGYTGDMPVTAEAGVVHGREFVMNADKTDKYYDLFQGIHTDDKELIKRGLADLLSGTGVTLPKNITNDIRNNKESIKGAEIKLLSENNNSDIVSRLDKLESHLSVLVKQGNESEVVLSNGTVITKKGSLTTIKKHK